MMVRRILYVVSLIRRGPCSQCLTVYLLQNDIRSWTSFELLLFTRFPSISSFVTRVTELLITNPPSDPTNLDFSIYDWSCIWNCISTRSSISHSDHNLKPYSERDAIGFHPIITSLNLWNSPPCKGFVKKSANIASVGQYFTDTSPALILSFMKKYLIFIWRDFCPADIRPFVSNLIADSLSW